MPSPDPSEPIDLSRGWPNPSLLPTDLIRSAAQRALSDPEISTPGLLYGPDPGYEPLRESIAKWMTDFYHPDSTKEDAVTAERIAITGGASQNLGCLLSVYTDPGYTRCVWVVAPAYFLAFRIFEDAGLQMRAVPEDEEVVDIEYLRREIEKVEHHAQKGGKGEQRFKGGEDRPWAKTYRHVIYCVTTFANPSSKTMSLQRRKDLVHLAREHDALVVSDDVYDFLQWPSDPSTSTPSDESKQTAHLPRLIDIDRYLTHSNPPRDVFGNACSNASLSKLAGPGIRVGWCEGSPAFAYGISQAGTTKSGGAPSQLTSTYVHLMLASGEMQKHIQGELVPAYRRRWAELMGAIERELVPLGFGMPQPTREVVGGYFTWLTLPRALCSAAPSKEEQSPAEALAARGLSDANVVISPGDVFAVPGDHASETTSFGHCVRLCWSWEDEGRLAEGVKRIARVAEAMLEEAGKQGIGKGYVMVEKKKEKKRGG